MVSRNRGHKLYSRMLSKSNNDASCSRFCLVVVQYNAEIDAKKLQSEIHAYTCHFTSLDPPQFDLRLVSEKDNARITGYSHNAVTPFGLLEKIPVILAKAIVTNMDMTQFIWMGDGHIHLKVGVAVKEFINFTKSMVLDVTNVKKTLCDNETD